MTLCVEDIFLVMEIESELISVFIYVYYTVNEENYEY